MLTRTATNKKERCDGVCTSTVVAVARAVAVGAWHEEECPPILWSIQTTQEGRVKEQLQRAIERVEYHFSSAAAIT